MSKFSLKHLTPSPNVSPQIWTNWKIDLEGTVGMSLPLPAPHGAAATTLTI